MDRQPPGQVLSRAILQSPRTRRRERRKLGEIAADAGAGCRAASVQYGWLANSRLNAGHASTGGAGPRAGGATSGQGREREWTFHAHAAKKASTDDLFCHGWQNDEALVLQRCRSSLKAAGAPD